MSAIPKSLIHLHREAHSIDTRNIVLGLCDRNSDGRLLDCGCGDGGITMEVAQGIGAKEIWGIEITEANALKARERGIKVARADLNRPLPFESESFDVVHGANVIEHLYDTDTFLKEVYRVLRLGGYFIVSTCNLAAFHNIFFLLLGRQPPPADVSDEFQVGVWNAPVRITPGGPCHRRMFTFRALEELLECHRFKVEKSVGAGFYPLPIKLAKVMSRLDKRHSAYMTVKASKPE
jgi:SAM-dependent methyltransferase